MEVPPNGWCLMENRMKMDDLGIPPECSICKLGCLMILKIVFDESCGSLVVFQDVDLIDPCWGLAIISHQIDDSHGWDGSKPETARHQHLVYW